MNRAFSFQLSFSVFIFAFYLIFIISGCIINTWRNSPTVQMDPVDFNLFIRIDKTLPAPAQRGNTQWNKKGKVETVKLLAETTSLIATAGEKHASKADPGFLAEAEKLLAQSDLELKRKHFEDATHLADQAIQQIRNSPLGTPLETQAALVFNRFPVPVIITLLQTGIIRKSPSQLATVNVTVPAGSHVKAIGHMGTWVQVTSSGYGAGWIHYSSLTEE